ncbi:MAG: hypothetical protein K5931_08340 [Lachnospiraceae bacterium]|nr:hypothetical protein [Lachnospiraceae bacterium]
MKSVKDIKLLYEEYFESVKRVQRSRGAFEGILGFGKKLSNEPCHFEFQKKLKDYLDEIKSDMPESETLKEILSFIYCIHREQKSEPSIYWMLIAVHMDTLELIEGLSSKDADELLKLYGRLFKKHERLPAQNKLYDKLKTRSEAGRD